MGAAGVVLGHFVSSFACRLFWFVLLSAYVVAFVRLLPW